MLPLPLLLSLPGGAWRCLQLASVIGALPRCPRGGASQRSPSREEEDFLLAVVSMEVMRKLAPSTAAEGEWPGDGRECSRRLQASENALGSLPRLVTPPWGEGPCWGRGKPADRHQPLTPAGAWLACKLQ